jgi:outer membrane protein assembly factor BamB
MPRFRARALWPVAALLAAGVGVSSGLDIPKAAPGEWPGFRGPNRDGISKETGLLQSWPASGPPLAWKATGLGEGYSSVSVAGGRIFTLGDISGSQMLIAKSAADGKTLWTTKVGPPWSDERGGPRGTPTVDGDSVYAVGTEGDLVAVEAATGKERWRKSLPKDFGGQVMSMWKWSESPLVDGDRVVVTPGAKGAGLVALKKADGSEIWRTALPDLGTKGKDGAGYSSIVIGAGGGVRQYVQLMGRGLVGVDSSSGKLLWNYNKIANDVANISAPLVSGDLVFASTAYSTGSSLLKITKTASGLEASEVYFLDAKTLQNHHGGLVLVDGKVYAGHGQNKGLPICVEMATGKVLWGGDIRNAGSGSAAVVYADGNLIFRYENGTVILIEATPAGYREKGSFQIPDVKGPSWPYPVVAGGKLYLREADNLYCYDVRKAS